MVTITRKGTCVQEQLLEYIGKEGYYPHSTSELALKLGYSWHTIQQYCFELLLRGKIDRLTTGGSHIWIKKGSYSSKGETHDEGAQKNQLKEQFLNHFAEKQLSHKIDEAIEQLLNHEINRTFKDLQMHLKKNSSNKKQSKNIPNHRFAMQYKLRRSL